MTPEETLLEAVKHSQLYMTVDREVLRAHLQFVAAERVKLNERIAKLALEVRRWETRAKSEGSRARRAESKARHDW